MPGLQSARLRARKEVYATSDAERQADDAPMSARRDLWLKDPCLRSPSEEKASELSAPINCV
jgi:hypothetical protein